MDGLVSMIIETLLIVCLSLARCALAKHLWPNMFGGTGGKSSPSLPSDSMTAAEEILFYNTGASVYHVKDCQRVSHKSKELTLCLDCTAKTKKKKT